MSVNANVRIATSNNFFFTDSVTNDLVIYTGLPTQRILFGTSNTNSRLVINSNFVYVNSNFGIGKSNPAYPLDIIGDLNFSGTLRQGGTPYVGSQWSNNSSNVFLFGSNVGLGTSNPSEQLEVVGDIKVSSNIYAQNHYNIISISSNFSYPSGIMTANTTIISGKTYGNGTYNASVSRADNGTAAYQVFDTSSNTYWELISGYTGTGNTYNSTTSTTTSGSNILGEWIQLQTPSNIRLMSYSMLSRGSFWNIRMPNSWVVSGSLDGTTWNTIENRSNVTGWIDGVYTTFTITNYANYYNYYRFIITQGNDPVVNIGDMLLYGNDGDTAALPSFAWSNDINTGIFHPAVSNLGFTIGAQERARLTQTGLGLSNFIVLPYAGSNAKALANIVDVSSNWPTFSNTGTFSVINNTLPSIILASNAAIDIGSGFYTFSNNGNVASSNFAHSNILSADFTIESWVYYYAKPPNGSSSTWVSSFIGNMSPSSGTVIWSFGVNSNMQLSFFANAVATGAGPTGGAGIYTPTSNIIPLNTWTHIAVTYSNIPRTMQLLVNSVPQNLTTLNATWVLLNSTTASNSLIHSGGGTGNVILGKFNNSNNPCYIYDTRVITGTTYTPSNPVFIPASNLPGTRLLLRAALINKTSTLDIIGDVNITNGNLYGSNIYTSGNLGVGKSNPAYPVDISGDLNFTGILRQGGVPYVGSQWSNNSSNVFLFASNVGLGVSNPQAQLHISSNLRVDGNISMVNTLQLGGITLNTTGGNNSSAISAITSNLLGWSNTSNGLAFSIASNTSNYKFSFIAGTSSNEVLKIQGDGNIVLPNRLQLNGLMITQRQNTLINNITSAVPIVTTPFGGAQLNTLCNTTITTGSNASALSNIIDASGTWATLCNVGTMNVINNAPNSYYNSNASIDIGRGYFQFSNNGSLFASSNIAHSNIISTSFTIESWVYYYANPPQTPYYPSLIGTMSPSNTVHGWIFGVTSNMQLSLGCYANNTTVCGIYTQCNVVPLNTWTHVGMSYTSNNSNIQFYVNGVAQSNLIAVSPWLTYNTSSNMGYHTSISMIGNTTINTLVIGQYNNSINPCYIHDLRMTTGIAYTPSNPPIVPLSTPIGTRLLLRGGQVNLSGYNPISIVPNGCIGVGTSNPLYSVDVNGSLRANNIFVNNFGIATFRSFGYGSTGVIPLSSWTSQFNNLSSNILNSTGTIIIPYNGLYTINCFIRLNNYNVNWNGISITTSNNTAYYGTAGAPLQVCDSTGGNMTASFTGPFNFNDGIYVSVSSPVGNYVNFAVLSIALIYRF